MISENSKRATDRSLDRHSEIPASKRSQHTTDVIANDVTIDLISSPCSRRKEGLRRQLSAPDRSTLDLADDDVTTVHSTSQPEGMKNTWSTRRRSDPLRASVGDLCRSIGRGSRHTLTMLRESMTSVRDRMARRRSSDKCPGYDIGGRNVKVDIASEDRNRKKRTRYVISLDAPYQNYSSCLTMMSLKNGRFTAELPLCDVPVGDLTLRVESHQVLLLISDKRGNSKHRVVQSYVCGYLHLPIYVDPFTLHLGVERVGFIQINCLMKGYIERRVNQVTPPTPTSRVTITHSHSSPALGLFKSSKHKLQKQRRVSNMPPSAQISIEE